MCVFFNKIRHQVDCWLISMICVILVMFLIINIFVLSISFVSSQTEIADDILVSRLSPACHFIIEHDNILWPSDDLDSKKSLILVQSVWCCIIKNGLLCTIKLISSDFNPPLKLKLWQNELKSEKLKLINMCSCCNIFVMILLHATWSKPVHLRTAASVGGL